MYGAVSQAEGYIIILMVSPEACGTIPGLCGNWALDQLCGMANRTPRGKMDNWCKLMLFERLLPTVLKNGRISES